jgi:glutaredoxin-related protein
LLADFQPKGAVAASYGLFLEEAGITDRATVIIDAGGVVRHISSVGPGGSRDIEELAALCEGVDKEHGQGLPNLPEPAGVSDATLYIKSSCGFSLRALNARANLHLEQQLKLANVSEDAEAMSKLKELTDKETAPCLVVGGEPLLEVDDIVLKLAALTTDL